MDTHSSTAGSGRSHFDPEEVWQATSDILDDDTSNLSSNHANKRFAVLLDELRTYADSLPSEPNPKDTEHWSKFIQSGEFDPEGNWFSPENLNVVGMTS